MKKVLLVLASALLVTGVAFAEKGKKKKCAKGKSGCSKEKKACCKSKKSSEEKTTTATM